MRRQAVHSAISSLRDLKIECYALSTDILSLTEQRKIVEISARCKRKLTKTERQKQTIEMSAYLQISTPSALNIRLET